MQMCMCESQMRPLNGEECLMSFSVVHLLVSLRQNLSLNVGPQFREPQRFSGLSSSQDWSYSDVWLHLELFLWVLGD